MIKVIMYQSFKFIFVIIITTEVIMAQDDVELCLRSQDCWVQYNFTYDSTWNACHGKQYISHTRYPEAPFLGVVLCTNTRYKLFLSTAPWEEFLNIADSSGHGQDHCELVGGSEVDAILPIDFWDTPAIIGFYRSKWGQSFQKGRIGFGPKDGSDWSGNYFTKWYECMVTIPGKKQVIPVADFPMSSTSERNLSGTTTSSLVQVKTSTPSTAGTTPVPKKSTEGVTECPPGKFGLICDESCHCDGDVPCNAIDGKCPNDKCAPGWKGDSCSQGSSNMNLIIGLSVSVAILVVMLPVAILLAYHRAMRVRTSKQDHKNNEFDDNGQYITQNSVISSTQPRGTSGVYEEVYDSPLDIPFHDSASQNVSPQVYENSEADYDDIVQNVGGYESLDKKKSSPPENIYTIMTHD